MEVPEWLNKGHFQSPLTPRSICQMPKKRQRRRTCGHPNGEGIESGATCWRLLRSQSSSGVRESGLLTRRHQRFFAGLRLTPGLYPIGDEWGVIGVLVGFDWLLQLFPTEYSFLSNRADRQEMQTSAFIFR
jgi:hypothetical protein